MAPRPAPAPEVRELRHVPRIPDGRVDLVAAAVALDGADLLETARGPGWSYVVPRIGPRLIDDGDRVRWVGTDGSAVDVGDDPFAALDGWAHAEGVAPHAERDAGGPPFTGGLVGALGYDLVHRTERLPRHARVDRAGPWLSLRLAPVVLAVAPGGTRALLVHRPLGSPVATYDRDAAAALADRVAHRLRDAAHGAHLALPAPREPVPVTSSMDRDTFRSAVERALAAIARGDAFQVNLAHRLTAPTVRTTHQLYADLRAASPAPHGAALADLGVASVSPETFLRVDGDQVTVRPIKGTRARHADPRLDAAQADDLLTSDKDRAENVMVVDLERNDLGRVCAVGSVHVPSLCELEAHPTVWHLTSEITGRLPEGVGFGTLLRATFPCGSITGAPKIAAATLIDRLEPVTRGWYCGAIGAIGPGHASLSVAIRTATRHADGTVDHPVGAGIVADSDPTAEHDETLAKADAFLRAVGGRPTEAVTGRSGRSRRAHRAAG